MSVDASLDISGTEETVQIPVSTAETCNGLLEQLRPDAASINGELLSLLGSRVTPMLTLKDFDPAQVSSQSAQEPGPNPPD
jgi:hypothetical protein